MDCNTCKERRKQADPVSFAAYESMKATLERTITRLWIALILVIVLFVGSNVAWIWYESQWEVFETEVTQEADRGINNYIGNDGDIYNGKTDYQDEGPSP